MNIFARTIALDVSTTSFERISLAAKNNTSLSVGAKNYFQNPYKRIVNFLIKKLGHDDLYRFKDETMDSLARTVKSACGFSSGDHIRESHIFILTDKNGKNNTFKLKEYYNNKSDFGISLVEVLPGSTYEGNTLYSVSGLTLQNFIDAPL